MAAIENGNHFWIVIIAVLFAAVSAFYYFRIIQAMYFKEPLAEEVIESSEISLSFKILLAITAILIIVLGIYPELILGWLYH